MMKFIRKKKGIISRICMSICLMVVIVITMASCGLSNAEDTAAAPPIIPREKIEYAAHTVTLGNITDEISTYGSVMAVEQHNLYHDAGGILVEYNVSNNQKVKAGEVLAVFSDEDVSSQLREQRRSFEKANIAYDSVVREKDSAQTSFSIREELINLEIEIVKDEYAAAKKQISNYYADDRDVYAQKAQLKYESALYQLEEELKQMENAIKNYEDSCRIAQLTLNAEAEKLSKLEALYKSASIRAPIDGVVTYFKYIALGDSVSSDEVLFTISSDSDYYIVIPATKDFTAEAEVKLEASIRLEDTRETIVFEGSVVSSLEEVYQLDHMPESSTLIRAEEWPEEVGLGDYVKVSLLRDTRYNVVVIPSNAVTRIGDYAFVRVLEGEVLYERAVETGIQTETEIEIVAGLEPGENIVLK